MNKYILGDIFKDDYPISQYFSQRPEYYQQFGFAGHEGVDWATPTGTKIIAPFNGKIVRDVDDPKNGAYGNHIVLWDPLQKCAVWFCHLFENNTIINQSSKKGEILGKTGNSGKTSGPHLHFNFCETDKNGARINLDNGYKGFLNPLDPNLIEWKLGDASQPAPQDPINIPTGITRQEAVKAIYLGILGINPSQSEIDARITQLATGMPLHDIVSQVLNEDDRSPLQKLNEQIKNLTSANNQQADMINDLQKQLENYQLHPPIEPIFKTALGKLLYAWAKQLG